ncbi:MAG TPA: PDZ domain-containing protein, partial [Chloroflexia bacterium]|nr:PDZ domain-containing protein [Chloroflexia bacterium]
TAGSPAATAGVQPGDVLLAVDGRPLEEPDSLRHALLQTAGVDRLRLHLLRGGNIVEVEAQPAPVEDPAA